MSSTKDSCLICESLNKNTHGVPSPPASLVNFFKSSRHSVWAYTYDTMRIYTRAGLHLVKIWQLPGSMIVLQHINHCCFLMPVWFIKQVYSQCATVR